MSARPRRAFTLLEVIVALAILGIAGSAMLLASAQAERSVRSAQDSETRQRRAEKLLAEVVALDQSTLLSLVGRREMRGHTVVVSQLDDARLRIVVTERSAGAHLETTVYRPPSFANAR